MEPIRESYPPRRGNSGFTLIELLVVLAIITIVTAIVITSQSNFNRTLVLANTAYDVALSLRYAESYGLGSRASGTTLNAGYGLHFSTPGSFILFADTNPSVGQSNHPTGSCHPAPTYDPTGPSAHPGNCVYDQGEQVQTYNLGNGITLSDFCAQLSDGSWSCTYAHDGASGNLTSLDVVFSRPNPTPFMSKNGSYPDSTHNPEVTNACLTLASSDKTTFRYISISQTGEINANAASCPTS